MPRYGARAPRPLWSRSRIGATAAAASLVLTVIRTSSEPARARALTCCAVPSTSAVSVFVMDCTTMGAPPPTWTEPMETWTEGRREIDMGAAGSPKPGEFYRVVPRSRAPERRSGCAWAALAGGGIIRGARFISLFGESPGCLPERRRRKFRPETLRHTNGRLRNVQFRAGSGERWTPRSGPPTEGERRRVVPDLSGRKDRGAAGAQAVRLPPFFIG